MFGALSNSLQHCRGLGVVKRLEERGGVAANGSQQDTLPSRMARGEGREIKDLVERSAWKEGGKEPVPTRAAWHEGRRRGTERQLHRRTSSRMAIQAFSRVEASLNSVGVMVRCSAENGDGAFSTGRRRVSVVTTEMDVLMETRWWDKNDLRTVNSTG